MTKADTILITGAYGFLGQSLIKQLEPLTTLYTLGRKTSSHKNYIQADITKTGHWQRMIADLKPTSVIHLAGISSGRNEILYPNQQNINGTNNVLQAVKDSCKWFFFAGSSAVYGNQKSKLLIL